MNNTGSTILKWWDVCLQASVTVFFFGIFNEYPKKIERPVLHPLLIKDKIAYYGALSSNSDAVNITVTNAGACEV